MDGHLAGLLEASSALCLVPCLMECKVGIMSTGRLKQVILILVYFLLIQNSNRHFAAVMKADGTVKRSELDYVKRYYFSNFGTEHGAQYIKMLGEVLKQDFNVQEVSTQIGRYMDYSSKLLLIQYLFGVALADGKHHPTEISLINSISGFMGIGYKDYESIKAMFIKDTESAYKILEVEASASNNELKTAYRELAKKYHPDKVSHLGEDVKLAAEQKFTKLNAAYEAVKQERGIN